MPRGERAAVLDRERAVMLAVWSLAALACLLGGIDRPSPAPHESLRAQFGDVIRVVSTAALAVTLILGPGIAWRAARPARRIRLGFLPLPGLALLVCAGGLAWALATPVGAHVASFAVLAPVLGLLLVGLLRSPPGDILEPSEKRALLAVGAVLGLAISRALWSLGPEGELYGGTISRTLEVGDRSDSRISFHIVQLVANGLAPYGELGASYFFPYNFSSRGPLPGLMSAPVVLLSGGRPPTAFPPEQQWAPFDAQGFMAYRITMMAFAATAFLSLWTLTRQLAGTRTAQFALLLAATTPFLVHEVWFTWPKMLAASLALLAAASLFTGRPLRAGLLVGVGYLVHPVALMSLPALGLLAVWPLIGARWNRPRVTPAVLLIVGVALFVVAWRVVNGSHYTQSGFLNYLTEAGPNVYATPWGDPLAWFGHRLKSLSNTLVPLLLPLGHPDHPSINVFGGTSPPIIHHFFQYWNTLPFGVGILFFPLLLLSLWRAWRRWRWPVFASIVVPFGAFALYWGSFSTGLLREGLQAWVLSLAAVVATQQWDAAFAWLKSKPIRIVLALRPLELFAIAVVPAVATQSMLLGEGLLFTDAVAFVAICAFCVGLAILVWEWTGEEAGEQD